MRKLVVFVIVLFLTSAVQASFGTFVSDKQQDGPEAEFKIGVVADEEISVEIDVEEAEELDYEYDTNITFDTEDSDSQYMYHGEYLPVNYYSVNVSDVNPEQGVYEIPVTLRAYKSRSSFSGPLVVQERKYNFEYASGFEEEHGFEGELIAPEESAEQNMTEEEETKTSEQLNETEGEAIEDEQHNVSEADESRSASTYILAVLLVLTVVYIIREVLK